MKTQKISLISALIFAVIGMVAGYISTWLLSMMSWELGMIGSFVTFGLFFAILVWMGRARFGLSYLLMFAILGYVASFMSGFLADMWGFSGSLMGMVLDGLVFFLLIALVGRERTGVSTA